MQTVYSRLLVFVQALRRRAKNAFCIDDGVCVCECSQVHVRQCPVSTFVRLTDRIIYHSQSHLHRAQFSARSDDSYSYSL